jgi:hypothetical protein
MKPPSQVRGTWREPEEAAAWLWNRLAQLSPRFASGVERDARWLTALTQSAAERLTHGGDVSLGHYLRGTLFHSVALVTCSPNRSSPELACPTL